MDSNFKYAVVLCILLPVFGMGQRYIKPQRVDADTIKIKIPQSDTSNKVAVFDANGILKYNRSAGGGGSTVDSTKYPWKYSHGNTVQRSGGNVEITDTLYSPEIGDTLHRGNAWFNNEKSNYLDVRDSAKIVGMKFDYNSIQSPNGYSRLYLDDNGYISLASYEDSFPGVPNNGMSGYVNVIWDHQWWYHGSLVMQLRDTPTDSIWSLLPIDQRMWLGNPTNRWHALHTFRPYFYSLDTKTNPTYALSLDGNKVTQTAFPDVSNGNTAYSWGNHASAGYMVNPLTQTGSLITLDENLTLKELPMDLPNMWLTNKEINSTGKYAPSWSYLPDFCLKTDTNDVKKPITFYYANSHFQPIGSYLTSYTETDPLVYSWAKAATKPSYTYSDVGAAPAFTSSTAGYSWRYISGAWRSWPDSTGTGSSYTAGYRIGISGSSINNTNYWKDQDTINSSDGILKVTSKKVTSITDNSSNWNSAYTVLGWGGWYGFTNNSESYLSFNPTTATLTFGKTGASNITYIRDAVICQVTADQSLQISTSGSAGTYFFYIDNTTGILETSAVAWTLKDTKVPVAVIKWNPSAPAGIKYKMEDERHGGSILNGAGGLWPRGLHYYAHANLGTKYQSGGVATGTVGGSTTVQNQIRITEGEIDDEDMSIILPVKAAPTTQVANNWLMYYRTAASTWTWDTLAVPYPYAGATAGVSAYIQYDNGGTLTASVNNRWVNSYIGFTNIKGNSEAKDSARFIIIPGRNQFTSLALAQAEDPSTFDWTGFNIAECVIRYRVTWNTSGVASSVLGRVTLAAQPVAINVGVSASAIPISASGWTVIGSNVVQSVPGNVGIGDVETPKHTLSIVRAAGGINVVDPNYNKIRTDSILASDSSSFKVQIVGGNPKIDAKNKRGEITFAVDTSGFMSNRNIDSIWHTPTNIAYASTSTFTFTRGTAAIANMVKWSLVRAVTSNGATLKIGYITTATNSSGTVTCGWIGSADLASGDKIKIAVNQKIMQYQRYITSPAEVVADTGYQGMYYLNNSDSVFLLPVDFAVRKSAAGTGSPSCTFNIRANYSTLFGTAPDLTTNRTLTAQRPTTFLIPPGKEVDLIVGASTGTTNKAQGFQARLILVPSSLFRCP